MITTISDNLPSMSRTKKLKKAEPVRESVAASLHSIDSNVGIAAGFGESECKRATQLREVGFPARNHLSIGKGDCRNTIAYSSELPTQGLIVQRAEVRLEESIPPKLKNFIDQHPTVKWFRDENFVPKLRVEVLPMDPNVHGNTQTTPDVITITLNASKMEKDEKNLGALMETFTHEIVLHAKSFAKNLKSLRPGGVEPSFKKRGEELSSLRYLSVGEHNPLLDPDPKEATSLSRERAQAWKDEVTVTLKSICSAQPREVADEFVNEIIKDMGMHTARASTKEVNSTNQKEFAQELRILVQTQYSTKK